MLKRYRLVIVNVVLLLALGGSLYGKRIETSRVRKTGFLSRMALPFRDWKFEDQLLTAREEELLTPDDVISRLYHSPDKSQQVQFTVLAGHRKQTVHTPDACMVGDGWETITQQSGILHVGDREIQVSRSIMSNSKTGQSIVASFFFTDGRYCTTSITRYQVSQLIKRFGSGIPLGALVRIITPVAGEGPAAARQAETLTDEFAAATLPQVLKSLRETTLETL